MFGLSCNALLAGVGAPPSFTTAMVGGLVVVALVAVATYRQVQASARVVGVFMVIEAAFVAALAVVIIVAQAMRGGLSTAPLDPAAATGGPHGVIAAGPRLIRLAANATPGTYGPERLAAGQVSVTPCAATVLAGPPARTGRACNVRALAVTDWVGAGQRRIARRHSCRR